MNTLLHYNFIGRKQKQRKTAACGDQHCEREQTAVPEKLSFLLRGLQGHVAYKVQYLYEVISETQFTHYNKKM